MEEGEREVVVNQEEKLPSPEELIPLSQSLVDRNLASAFDIPTTTNPNSFLYPIPPSPLIPSHPSHQWMAGTNFDSVYLNSCCRSPFGFVFKKKKRTIWTPQLHRKFVEAVVRLGLENAAPGAITETMNVDGLSKESVNSHLQQFRLRLQREGILIKSGRKWRSLVPDADLTTDRLFAIIPLPLGGGAAAGGDEKSDSEERTDSEEKSDSEERSEEGCEENKELSPFPTGKDLSYLIHSDDRDSCGSDDNEVVRTKKKRRTVWTPQLHKKFVEAVAHLGVQNATPKAITETMNVDGLRRDSVSSHLQKYREFLEQKVNQIRKGVKKSVVLPGDSAMDRQITTIPLPSGPTSAPAGVDDGSFPLLFMNMASAKVENLSSVDGSEERSKEGCRENKELSLFPTGKDLSDGKENCISDDEELTKTNKNGSTVWTPKLYKMFVEAVAHLGIENATPGAIMEKMNVEGLSRDSVSNQLQRYILLLEQEWHRKKVVSAGYFTMNQLSATMLLPCGAAPPRGDERSKLDERIRIACGEIKELPLFPTGKDLSDRRGTCRSDEDEVVRNTKKQRTVWTPQLQKKFAEAVAQLGLENATAGAITKMMNVDGLTRDSVSSHLQNYRLHLQHLANSHGTSPARGDERSDLEARSKEGCGKIKELPLLLAGKDLSRDNCRDNEDDKLAKTKKKWKSVWTLDLHKMFVEAATHLGLENATPGAITERMNVDGLTNEIVSNYLQEYRLYLQRKGVLINSGGKWQMNNVVSAPAKDLR